MRAATNVPEPSHTEAAGAPPAPLPDLDQGLPSTFQYSVRDAL